VHASTKESQFENANIIADIIYEKKVRANIKLAII